MRRYYFSNFLLLWNGTERAVQRNNYFSRGFFTTSIKYNGNISWKSAKPFEDIPSLRMLPLIGTAWASMPIIGRYKLELPHEANCEKRKLLGDIFREKIGPLNAVVCFNVEDLKEVLRCEGKYPFRTEFSSIQAYRDSKKDLYNTNGLMVIQGKEWYDLRTKTQKHLLRPEAIKEFLTPMQDVARDMVQRIMVVRDANKEIPDIEVELCKWALEAVSLVGLDTRLGCVDINSTPDSDGAKMVQSVLEQFACMNKMEAFSGNLPYWRIFPTPLWKKFVKACDDYTEIAFKYINQSLQELENKEKNEDKRLTLLQSMLSNKDLDVKDAIVFVADMLMAGVETTSYTAGWLLYNLAKNPDKQQILFEEVSRLLPNKEMKVTPEIYDELRYLRSCIKESMRLNSVIMGTARKLAENAVLSGYKVPAGTLIFVPYQEIFSDEKNYTNASKFLPERWLNLEEKFDAYTFIPFGFGPRGCIGKRLAELELITFFTEIVRNFQLEYHYEDIGVIFKMVNAPDKPLRINFIERTSY